MKNLLIIILFLATLTSGFSQNDFSFGLKGGVNFSDVSGLPAEVTKGKIGYHVGIVTNFGLTEKLSLQPELLYSRQGFKNSEIELRFENDQAPVVFDLNSHLDYLNIPVLLSFEAADGLSLQGGPQIGIGIGSSTTVGNVLQGSESDIPDAFLVTGLSTNTIEVGFTAGIEYLFGDHLFAQARYVIGFTEVFEGGNDRNNRNGQVSVGYKF